MIAELVGLPYERGGKGPHAFYCWGLVQQVFRAARGLELPDLVVGATINAAAIKQAADEIGCRPVDDRAPAEWDIVLMTSIEGPHVGVMVRGDVGLMLLHAFDPAGVCAQTLLEAQACGFGGFVFWRRPC